MLLTLLSPVCTTLYLIYEACENESDLHEHEVRGRVEVGEGVERKVVVDTVERGWNKIKDEDVKVLRYNPNHGVYTVPRNTNLKYMYTRLGTQLCLKTKLSLYKSKHSIVLPSKWVCLKYTSCVSCLLDYAKS